jgi:hypothetical protein
MTLARGWRSWWRLAVALLSLGAVVAACGDTGNSGGGADEPAAQEPTGDPDEGVTPQRGGRLVFAREAETANPWTPAAMLCDTACNQLIRGIYGTPR